MNTRTKALVIACARALRTEEALVALGTPGLGMFLFWLYFQTYP